MIEEYLKIMWRERYECGGLRNCNQMKAWKKNIRKRDLKCIRCGVDSELCVHHLKSLKEFPWLAFSYNNGVTLCKKCHKDVHAGRVNIRFYYNKFKVFE